MNRILSFFRIVKFELYCLVCFFVGEIKAKVFFDPKAFNKLEIGAGGGKRDGFITLDLSLSSDFPYDLRGGLPFQDNSLDFIYAEHVLEHFCIQDVLSLLNDCKRVLKPGASLSVVVPDASIYVGAYNNNDFSFKEKYCLYEFGLLYKSEIDYLNYIFYMDGHHKYMFDVKNMLEILSMCGFSEVINRDFDVALDRAERRYESIYFVARKGRMEN